VSLGAVWGMFSDSVVMLVLGLSLIGCLIYMHHSNSKALISQISLIKKEITEKTSDTTFNFDELKEDMLDMVHETIGNMQPPNAFDHLLGALAGPIQAWAMRKAGINPQTGQILEQILPEEVHQDL
jgi:hypothetical protein